MYNDYKFEIIPIIIGAFSGFIPSDFKTSLGNLNFEKKRNKEPYQKIANYNCLRHCKNC